MIHSVTPQSLRSEPWAGNHGIGQAGCGILGLARAGGRTVVRRALAQSPLRLLTPRNHGHAAWVYTSTYGGGLVGGDSVALEVDVGPGAAAFLSTQASTKVYRAERSSHQRLQADVGGDGLLVLWPDPVMCFAGSAYAQDQVVSLAESASLFAVDSLASGRRAAGERWAFRSYRSRLIVRRAGRLLVHESLRLDPNSGPLGERLGRFNHLAVVVLIGPRVAAPAARLCTELSGALVVERSDLLVSCSPLSSGAVLRVAAADTEQVRTTLARLLSFLPDLLGDDPLTRKW